jgi:hypothetical protein
LLSWLIVLLPSTFFLDVLFFFSPLVSIPQLILVFSWYFLAGKCACRRKLCLSLGKPRHLIQRYFFVFCYVLTAVVGVFHTCL